MQAASNRPSNHSFVVYIDESGDEGFSFHKNSSPFFVLGAAVYRRRIEREQVRIVDAVRGAINDAWKRDNPHRGQRIGDKKPLHFRDLKHDEKRLMVSHIAASRMRAIAILVDKRKLTSAEKFRPDNRLYHYAVRLLVERVSWLCRDAAPDKEDTGDGSARLVFSNRNSLDYSAISAYLQHLEDCRGILDYRGEPSVIRPSQVDSFSHGKRMGLQVADALASAACQAVTPNKFGMPEPVYLMGLKPAFYRHKSALWGYGIKILPSEAEESRRRGDILKELKDW